MATNTHHHERDYRGFCKALKENPSITFRQYCDDIGARKIVEVFYGVGVNTLMPESRNMVV